MKNRNYNLDIIRIIACIGVVLLHTMGYKYNIIYYIGTVSIPLFFMISGFCILQKDKISLKYILEKVINLVILIFIWSVFFSILHIVSGKMQYGLLDIFIGAFIQKNDLALLWFLWAIILMYIVSLVLRKILNSKNDKLILGLLFAFSSIIFGLNIFLKIKYDFIIQDKIIQTLRIWTWITFFYFGGIIGKYNSKYIVSKQKYYYFTLILLIIVSIIELIIAKFIFKDIRCENFYDSIAIKILSFLIFTEILNVKIDEKHYNMIIKFSKATFGVYILQILALRIINKVYNWESNLINMIIFIILTSILFVISIQINKIKIINKVINTNFIKLNKYKKNGE